MQLYLGNNRGITSTISSEEILFLVGDILLGKWSREIYLDNYKTGKEYDQEQFYLYPRGWGRDRGIFVGKGNSDMGGFREGKLLGKGYHCIMTL